MEPIRTFVGIVAPLERANVDTDQIIPKQFLRSIERTGFGDALFFDWRYLPDGSPNLEFELNAPHRTGATILVADTNFGCGSSREHAVWAVQQYGFKAVIAPSKRNGETCTPGFADIFRNNTVNNGLLLIELAEEEVKWIFAVAKGRRLEATVNLDAQTVSIHGDVEKTFHFDITPDVKERLLKGLDAIDLTLAYEADISAYEAAHDLFLP
ncbi:MAG: 3-isopropylmalate dehydratase small subunit [Verrucomicrobiota bacterium]|jgi:3-isopropylmalate/(R)-2-methylmalate dehydratase small subunit|nr:3-isopropylmalate dehydratase small subunit [Verrucomicrobiota bacterium]